MIYLYIYIAGIFIAQILLAINNQNASVRDTISVSYLWPISLVIVLIIAIGWDIDVVYCKNKFGFRRRQNSKYPGFAVAIFNIEYQFWKRE